ncbi:MAG TPA: LLM class F420-dependent oxidoreductase [Thermodesulfobacteriota bacterium]|nr:LLM class F420-dependent oxidoreductase [Thermodesulfobacteriota bacterium]
MKIGIALPVFGKYAGRDEILETALAAEALGYDSIWVSDHVVVPDSHNVFGDVFYDPLIALGFIVSATSRIELGTSVMVLPYRNPLVLAKSVSSLDALSGGRVVLGVGSGWLRGEFEALGVDYGQRGRMTDEYIEIMKELWTKGSPAYEGEYFSFSGIRFEPKPGRKPHPPVWVGGESRRAVERAVKYGDGWHPVGLGPEEVEVKAREIRSLLPDEKRESFVISLRRNVEINEGREFGPEETLRGTLGKIRDGIESYREAGVQHLILYVLSGEFEGVLRTMRVLREEVL